MKYIHCQIMSEYDGGLHGYSSAGGGAGGGGLETLAAMHDPYRGTAGMPLVNHAMHSPYGPSNHVPSVSNHVMPVADGQKRDKDAIYGYALALLISSFKD